MFARSLLEKQKENSPYLVLQGVTPSHRTAARHVEKRVRSQEKTFATKGLARAQGRRPFSPAAIRFQRGSPEELMLTVTAG